jgi:hypothetical protein
MESSFHQSVGRKERTAISCGVLHESNQAGMRDAEFIAQYCTTTLDCTRDQPVGVHGGDRGATKGAGPSLVKHGGKSIRRGCMPT